MNTNVQVRELASIQERYRAQAKNIKGEAMKFKSPAVEPPAVDQSFNEHINSRLSGVTGGDFRDLMLQTLASPHAKYKEGDELPAGVTVGENISVEEKMADEQEAYKQAQSLAVAAGVGAPGQRVKRMSAAEKQVFVKIFATNSVTQLAAISRQYQNVKGKSLKSLIQSRFLPSTAIGWALQCRLSYCFQPQDETARQAAIAKQQTELTMKIPKPREAFCAAKPKTVAELNAAKVSLRFQMTILQ